MSEVSFDVDVSSTIEEFFFDFEDDYLNSDQKTSQQIDWLFQKSFFFFPLSSYSLASRSFTLKSNQESDDLDSILERNGLKLAESFPYYEVSSSDSDSLEDILKKRGYVFEQPYDQNFPTVLCKKSFFKKARKFVKKHPIWTAVIVIGTGAILGGAIVGITSAITSDEEKKKEKSNKPSPISSPPLPSISPNKSTPLETSTTKKSIEKDISFPTPSPVSPSESIQPPSFFPPRETSFPEPSSVVPFELTKMSSSPIEIPISLRETIGKTQSGAKESVYPKDYTPFLESLSFGSFDSNTPTFYSPTESSTPISFPSTYSPNPSFDNPILSSSEVSYPTFMSSSPIPQIDSSVDKGNKGGGEKETSSPILRLPQEMLSMLVHEGWDLIAQAGNEVVEAMGSVSKILPGSHATQLPSAEERQKNVSKVHDFIDWVFHTDKTWQKEKFRKEILPQMVELWLPPPGPIKPERVSKGEIPKAERIAITTKPMFEYLESQKLLDAKQSSEILKNLQSEEMQAKLAELFKKYSVQQSSDVKVTEATISPFESLRELSIRKFKGAERTITEKKALFKEEHLTEMQVRNVIHEAGIKTFPRPEGIPENWIVKFSDKGCGMKYTDPANKNNFVRIMPGKPHGLPTQQKPYVAWQKHGKRLDKYGNIVIKKCEESHIPLEEFVFKE